MQWLCSCGFGLLLYGFGSKKSLLEDFANSALMDGAAIVVSGYLPNINIKHVSACFAYSVYVWPWISEMLCSIRVNSFMFTSDDRFGFCTRS